jgi:hypothetical protein
MCRPLTFCGLMVTTMLLAALEQSPAAAAEFVVAADGKPAACIVLPTKPVPEETNAANELALYLGKITGATFRIVAEESAPAGPQMHVGRTAAALKLTGPLAKTDLDADAIMLKCVPPERLFLLGRNPWGTQFAVDRFLYRFAGVRWYMPTEVGEHVPRKATFTVPSLDRTESPAWLSRRWSAADRVDGGQWDRRNLMRPRFQFHHALGLWIKPELFDKHPDWFPLRPDGQRYRPHENDESWQPCMSNPAVAQYVADRIIEQFDRDPSQLSASIGVNDSTWADYCQCDACKALDVPGRQSLHGGPNYSNRFFTFANRVAERVAAKHPNRYIGCLAYNACENPPSFKVHSMIVPYLTNDRAQWRDAKFAQADRDWIAAWRAVCPSVAVYNYDYGTGYVIPRVFTSLQGQYLRYCHDQGIKGWYAEIYCNWALDGPKAWLCSQLLWDANQKVDDLLADFYGNFFGPAAVPMRRYFELCEKRWLEQPGEAVWFRYFYDARQLDLFPAEVCAQTRALLDQAGALATAEPYRTRVALSSKAFHMTELYSAVYYANQPLGTLTTGEQIEAAAARLLRGLRAEHERQKFFVEVVDKEPLLKPVTRFESAANWSGMGAAMGQLWRLYAAARAANRPDIARRLIADLRRLDPDAQMATAAEALWTFQTSGQKNLLANGDFEPTGAAATKGSGTNWESADLPPGWSIWRRNAGEGKLLWASDGREKYVVLKHVTGACFSQTAPIKPGSTYILLADYRGKISAESKATLTMSWHDAHGGWLDNDRCAADLNGQVREGWSTAAVAGRAPANAATAVVMLFADRQAVDDSLAFDNVRLFELPNRDRKTK